MTYKKTQKGCPFFFVQYLSQSSLAQVGLKVAILEGHIGAAKVGILQRVAGGLGHGVPVRDGHDGADRVGELQLVVGGEVGKVLGLGRGAAGQRARRLLVVAVARGGPAGNGRVGGVEPDDDILPVVAVRARRDAVHGLVLGPVPRVHDGRLPVEGADARVRLALGAVAAAALGVAAGLKTAAV